MPYFAIVKKLREENSKQSKEIKKWYRELSTTKSEVEKINLKIQELEYRLATKDSSISELKDNIERAKKREERYLTIIEVEEFARFDIVVEVVIVYISNGLLLVCNFSSEHGGYERRNSRGVFSQILRAVDSSRLIL